MGDLESIQPDRINKDAYWDWTTPDFLRNGIQIATVADITSAIAAIDISSLADVNITSPTNGQVLTYNSFTNKWENAAAGGGSDLVSATLATVSGASALTINNSAGVTFDIPVTGVDVSSHAWQFSIDGQSFISAQADGDGVGSIQNANVIFNQPVVFNTGDKFTQFQDGSLSTPFTNDFPKEDWMIFIEQGGSGNGGAQLIGISASDTKAMLVAGLIGSTTPTAPAVMIAAAKSDGAGGIAPLGNTEILLEINNGTSIPLIDILGNGYVGIGTAAPTELLETQNDGNADFGIGVRNMGFGINAAASVHFNTSAGGSGLKMLGINNNIMPSSAGDLLMYASGTNLRFSTSGVSTGIYFHPDHPTSSPTVVFKADGNVGIGTTTPGNILEIVRNQDAGTLISLINTNATAGAAASFNAVSDVNQGFFGVTSSTYSIPYLAGNVGISGIFNSLIFAADVAAGGGGAIKFNIGGVTIVEQKMIILANGNVGIGNPTPGFKLDVAGDGEFVNLAGSNDLVLFSGAVSTFHIVSNIAPQATWIQSVGDNSFGQATSDLLFRNTATGNNIVFTEFGSVGIGTTTPLYPLHVVGEIYGTLDLRLAGTLVLSGSGPDEGVLAFDKSLEKFVISENGGPFVQLLTTSSVTLQQAYIGGQTIGENSGGIVITRGSGDDTLPLLEVDNYFGGSVQNAIRVGSNQGAIPFESFVANASNTSTPTAFTLRHVVSGSPNGANGIGVAQIFDLPSDDGTQRGAAKITGGLADVTNLAEKGYFRFEVMSAGVLTDIFDISDTGVTVNGKLTVTGAIDPTSLSLAGTTSNTFLNSTDGQLVAVAPSNQGRMIYDNNLKKFRMSVDGGAYQDVPAGAGTGTVTSVSVTTANGVSGSVATATTTPAITLTLGAITPTTVNGLTLAAQSVGFTIAGGTTSKTLTVPLDATVSGTNTGDVSLAAVGAAPSANGATLSGQVLTLQPADGTHPGLVTTGAQTFAGAKTFSSTIAGSISGNAATVTTNANLTGPVTSVGNATTISAGVVTEAMQILANNTTNNVSITKHGYAPILPNDATKYLDGTGNYTVPAGSGSAPVTNNGVTQRAGNIAGSTETIAHGLGHMPTNLDIETTFAATSNTSPASSFGHYNGTTTATSFFTGAIISFAVSAGNDTTNIIYIQYQGGTLSATVTWDATNFYLVWSAGTVTATNVFVSWNIY